MKANLNENSRFQLNRTEKTTEKRLLTSSNLATIVCTYEEQHKLAAQKTFFPNLASRQMKKKLYFSTKAWRYNLQLNLHFWRFDITCFQFDLQCLKTL